MQKFIAKYGLAAHLAIMAVAPLFLLLYFDTATITVVEFWLTLFGFIWTTVSPSLRPREMLHEARRRVQSAFWRDPMTWFLLGAVVVSCLTWLNDGVCVAYDAEKSEWFAHRPEASFLPGSVAGVGALPFAVSLAAFVIVSSLRNAVGRQGRAGFLVMTTLLAGISGALAGYQAACGNAVAVTWMGCSQLELPSFVGTGYGLFFLGGLAGLSAVYEFGWYRIVPVVLASLAGAFAGLLVFSPVPTLILHVAASLVLLVYACVTAGISSGMPVAFKFLIFYAVSVVLGAGIAYVVMPTAAFDGRVQAILTPALFPDTFLVVRETLGEIAERTWQESPWLGYGLGSFPVWLRFGATSADWVAIPVGVPSALNGWWTILMERGIVGALVLAALFGCLAWTWVRRLVKSIRHHLPSAVCLLGPVALAAVAVETLCDDTLSRPESVLMLLAFAAVSASFFRKER